MKVKYIGTYYKVVLEKDKVYDVLSVENGWYRIMTELDEEGLFPPQCFEVVEEKNNRSQRSGKI